MRLRIVVARSSLLLSHPTQFFAGITVMLLEYSLFTRSYVPDAALCSDSVSLTRPFPTATDNKFAAVKNVRQRIYSKSLNHTCDTRPIFGPSVHQHAALVWNILEGDPWWR